MRRLPLLTRRAALAGLAALPLAGLPLSGCTPDDPEPAPQRRSAVVVGAGLSGLVAAYDLGRAGWDVLVLEAAAEVGGRIRTVRSPALPAGLHGDLGGDLVHPAHEHVLALARQLRVELRADERRPGSDDVVCTGGVPERLADVVTDEVRAALAAAREVLLLHADPSVEDVTCAAAVRALGMPPLAAHLLDAAVRRRHGAELTALSAAFVGSVLAREDADAVPQRIVGGADRLVQAVVQALAEAGTTEIRPGTRVSAVAQDGTGATVTHSGGEERVDRVVIAVPAPIASALDLGDDELAVRLAEVGTSSEARALLAFDRPVWRDERLTGALTGDGVVAATRDVTPAGFEGEAALLAVEATGASAPDLAALAADGGRLADAVAACLPPGAAVGARTAVAVDWADAPEALGGRPVFAPGAWARAAALQGPFGRIHIAGDHAGTASPGTMDAAVEAGRRAARQIVG